MLNSRSITRIQAKGGMQTTFNGETADLSHVAQKSRPRIESLTDLVFGLALSIGAIGLISNRPKNTEILVESIAGFGFSFLILISIWFRYTEVMSVLRVELSRTRVLNTTLLFLVAVEPYLFNLLNFNPSSGLGSLDDFASVGFAIDLGSIYAIMASLTSILATEEGGLVAPDLLKKYRRIRNLEIATALIFFVTTIPVFWIVSLPGGFPGSGGPIRYYAWLATFPIIRGENILRRFRKKSTR
jgi:uncharacterized membrane protein